MTTASTITTACFDEKRMDLDALEVVRRREAIERRRLGRLLSGHNGRS
jgi:hypothetical protein